MAVTEKLIHSLGGFTPEECAGKAESYAAQKVAASLNDVLSFMRSMNGIDPSVWCHDAYAYVSELLAFHQR